MKNILILIVFLIIEFNGKAQECKRIKEETDPISGLSVLIEKQTSNKGQSLKGFMSLYFSTNHRWIHLNVSLKRDLGRFSMNFTLKDPIKIIFTDNTSIILFPAPNYLSTSSIFWTDLSIMTIWYYSLTNDLTYSISRENVEVIAQKTVQTIRIYYSVKIDDYNRDQCEPSNDEFKEYNYSIGAGKLSSLAKCIISEY